MSLLSRWWSRGVWWCQQIVIEPFDRKSTITHLIKGSRYRTIAQSTICPPNSGWGRVFNWGQIVFWSQLQQIMPHLPPKLWSWNVKLSITWSSSRRLQGPGMHASQRNLSLDGWEEDPRMHSVSSGWMERKGNRDTRIHFCEGGGHGMPLESTHTLTTPFNRLLIVGTYALCVRLVSISQLRDCEFSWFPLTLAFSGDLSLKPSASMSCLGGALLPLYLGPMPLSMSWL
jgi:hypothetical protein